jgi:hypothetical protein
MVPWALLGSTPAAGERIGIDVQVNDDDDGAGRDRKLATFAESDDAWSAPRHLGTLALGPAHDMVGRYRAVVTVLDRLTGQPIPNAEAGVAPSHEYSYLSRQADGAGVAHVGDCGDQSLWIGYPFYSFKVKVTAPGYRDYRSDPITVSTLNAYCGVVEFVADLEPLPAAATTPSPAP